MRPCSGHGGLQCIDARQTGDITRTGRLWTYQGLDWTTFTTASIADGLLYLADGAGHLRCLDAETGRPYSVYEAHCGMLLGSTLVADGKVYMPGSRAFTSLPPARRSGCLPR